MVSLLETGEAPWIILTNGRLWRLYSRNAPSRASNFYEVDLGDALGQTAPFAGEPADAFRYFWLLLRRQSFVTGTAREVPARSLLDRLFYGSREFAARLGENLKDRVFEQIFQVLADGFIADIRHREGKDADLSQERLDEIFQGVLTLLYRLLFLLYAEARDLLPVRETREYFDASLTRLKSEIELAAGPIRDDEPEKLHDHYRTSSTALYERLKRLFDVIDRGDVDLSVPRYNGGLFLSKVSDDDGSTEAAAARFLNKNKVPDPFLAHALDLLSRDEDPKQHKLVPIDFKSLGVRQLGSIYEGLLEFKLRIASEKKAMVKEKARDVYVPFKDLSERERDRVESQERIVKRGELYLENDKGERKATGSYYTPDHIVSYIVEHAVGPVVREKFEGMRTRLREAEHWHRQAVRNAKAKGEDPNKYESGPAVETKWYMLVNDLFDLKILDPAMGSGHFLVETVDYITDKMLAFLNSFPWNPAAAHLDLVRQTILDEMDTQQISIDQRRLTDVNLLKRHVLKRCIYGVDLNPMAVELAKVSLWLHCFTLGAPLSFLDHHMRCGNSLIGVYVADVQQALGSGQSGQARLFGSQFAGLMLATDLMRHVGELSDVTTAQLDESKTEYKKASEALGPFKRLMDVYTSQWFRNGKSRKLLTEAREVAFLATEKSAAVLRALAQHASKMPGPLNKEEQEIIEQTVRSSSHKRFFHWELEFPEVFYGPRAGTQRIITRLDGAGFDAVIGNPPYDVLSNEELGYDVSPDLAFFRSQVTYSPALEGKSNLFKLFVCRSYTETSSSGFLSLIVPMALLGDQQTAGTRRLLLESAGPVVFEAFPQKDDPRNRVFEEAKLATCVFVARKRPTGEQFTVRTHRNAEISNDGVWVKMSPLDLLRLNGAGAIPTCSQRDWHIVSVLLARTSAERLRDYCEAFQGEINETTDGKRGFVSYDSSVGPLVLRGSMICLYALRDASQGEPMYLREQKYLKGKPDSLKAWHHQGRRMGWQESSALNNFRRIIAAPIPKGAYCNHKINYIPEKSSKLPLDFVLALLNSQLSDWFFRLQSTNAAVSHYQVLELLAPRVEGDTSRPVAGCTHLIDAARWNDLENCLCAPLKQPGIMPGDVVASIADLSRHVQKLEAKRVLKSRSERSHLGPESQTIQDLIDRTFFCCFGLSRDDESYIGTRLSEML